MTPSTSVSAPPPAAPPRQRGLPFRFHAWWVASTLSSAGDSLLAFAMIWAATGHGPAAVALVSSAAVGPRIALLLVGGAIGDRYGTRRTMIAAMTTQLLTLSVLGSLLGPLGFRSSPGFLVAAAASLAVVSAVQQPAAVVHARQLIDHDGQLPRVLARISGGSFAARIMGVACGGAVIDRWSLDVALAINAVAVAVALMVVALQRVESGSPPADIDEGRQGVLSSVAEGLRSARSLHIGPLLVSVALVCGAVLPTVSVAMPTAARARGWSSPEASLMESTWAAGLLVITLAVSWVGTLERQRVALAGGPLVVAAALVMLATDPGLPMALAASALLGGGTAVFTTHIAPTLLRQAPSGQMSRFQSLMSLVQLLPPALMNSPVAALAGLGTGSAAYLLAGALSLAASLLALRIHLPQTPPTLPSLDNPRDVR